MIETAAIGEMYHFTAACHEEPPISSCAKAHEFNFDSYYKVSKLLKLPTPSKEFLAWFIGFSEGDGSFIKATRGDLHFVVVQESKYDYILHYIQSQLGFGKVLKQGKTTSRFIVQDALNLYLIALIFNGNIVLPVKNENFLTWLNALNDKIKKGKFTRKLNKSEHSLILNALVVIEPINTVQVLTLSNSWFSGFVDAEGLFFCYFKKKGKLYYNIGFDIAQKDVKNQPVLDLLPLLFGVGKVYPHTVPNTWYFRVCGSKQSLKVLEYFERYPLRSNKLNNYLLWKEILKGLINKDHLINKDPTKLEHLMNLKNNLNK